MTLYDLLNGTTIMGDVRLSKWVEDFEIVLFQTYGTDHFGPGDIPEELEHCEVEYLFCPGDGFLHIEIEAVED